MYHVVVRWLLLFLTSTFHTHLHHLYVMKTDCPSSLIRRLSRENTHLHTYSNTFWLMHNDCLSPLTVTVVSPAVDIIHCM
jgi:hypothetical protein